MSTLQSIVDALGRRLQRAVAIDDPRMRLQAYSSHHGRVDKVRLTSILHREAPADAAAWVLSLGIADAVTPVRTPANPALGMDARVCVPIRCQGTLFGFLWLIDAECTLTDEGLEAASSAADAAGIVMHRERLMREIDRGRERELLRDLLAEDATVRDHAAGEFVETNLFVGGSSVSVLVVQPLHRDQHLPNEFVRTAISYALEQGRRSIPSRHSLQLVRPDHGLFVAATRDPALRPGGVEGLAEELREELLHALGDTPDWTVLVGIGDTHERLADTALSYWQARQAVRVAQVVPSFGTVVTWSQLGIYRMLSQFPVEQLAASALHPGLIRLFQRADAQVLVETLECYLDRGCDPQATAAKLVLHRASLYNRLRKIEQVAQVSLRNGEDRLALHLGLKLARLAGIHPLQRRG